MRLSAASTRLFGATRAHAHAPPRSTFVSIASRRSNSSASTPSTFPRPGNPNAPSSSATSTSTPKMDAKEQLLTLSEIDKLLTHIESAYGSWTLDGLDQQLLPTGARLTTDSSRKTEGDTPMVMRARPHPIPWMAAQSGMPELDTASHRILAPPLSEADKEALLKPRHMSASYTSFDLPLASDPKLYDLYVNFSGGFRMGKILENLDSLAGAIGYRHCLATAPPVDGRATENFLQEANRAGLYLVTASADRLDMFGKLNHENVRDLRFSGFVTYVGNSSLEVFVKMEGKRIGAKNSETLMLGRFSMVCRDAHTNKARKVPPLIIDTPEEKILWDIGKDHKESRSLFNQEALDKKPPTAEEAAELHDLFLETRGKHEYQGEQIVKMADTEIQKAEIMFPQERNLHGKVFGGFLMRMAFELCFTNCAIFAQQPLRFVALDQITFRLPVPIGSIVRLNSRIVKTTQPEDGKNAKAHVMVKAEVEEIETGRRRETNTFYFTMAKEDGKPFSRTVIPETYSEAMLFLEGGRRLANGSEMRRLYHAGGLDSA